MIQAFFASLVNMLDQSAAKHSEYILIIYAFYPLFLFPFDLFLAIDCYRLPSSSVGVNWMV